MTEVHQTQQPSAPPSVLGNPSGELRLRLHGGDGYDRTILVSDHKFTIGSANGCSLRLREPDISPVHCIILRGARGNFVRRLAGGTPARVPSNDAPLRPGDRLSLGRLQLEVLADAAPASTALDPIPSARPDPRIELAAPETAGDVVSAIEARMQRLEEQFCELQRHTAQLETSALKENLENLATQLDFEREQRRRQSAELTAERDQLAARLDCQLQQLAALEDQLEHSRRSQAGVEQRLQQANEQVAVLREQLEQLAEKRADAQRRHDADRQQWDQERAQNQAELLAGRKQLSELQSELENYRRQDNENTQERERLEAQLKELQKSLARSNQQCDQQLHQYSQQRSKWLELRKELETRLADAENTLAEQSAAAQQLLEEERAAWERQLQDELNQQLAEFEQAREQSEAETRELAEQCQALRERIGQLESQLESLRQTAGQFDQDEESPEVATLENADGSEEALDTTQMGADAPLQTDPPDQQDAKWREGAALLQRRLQMHVASPDQDPATQSPETPEPALDLWKTSPQDAPEPQQPDTAEARTNLDLWESLRQELPQTNLGPVPQQAATPDAAAQTSRDPQTRASFDLWKSLPQETHGPEPQQPGTAEAAAASSQDAQARTNLDLWESLRQERPEPQSQQPATPEAAEEAGQDSQARATLDLWKSLPQKTAEPEQQQPETPETAAETSQDAQAGWSPPDPGPQKTDPHDKPADPAAPPLESITFEATSPEPPVSTADVLARLGTAWQAGKDDQAAELPGTEQRAPALHEEPLPQPGPANPLQALGRPAEAPRTDEEQSIEDYMTSLLARVRGRDAVPGPAKAGDRQPITEAALHEAQQAEQKPKRTAPEQTAMAAMRDLANQSTRTAIATHAKSSWMAAAKSKLIGVAGGFCGTVASLLVAISQPTLGIAGAVTSTVILGYYAWQALAVRKQLLDTLPPHARREQAGKGSPEA